MSALDRVAFCLAVLYGVARALNELGSAPVPLQGFLGFLCILAGGYFLVRLLPWVRAQVLWSLRNRLIVAYLFIAVVPVVLLLTMAAVSAYLMYLQLGAHLLHDDLQDRTTRVAVAADAVSGALLSESRRGLPEDDERVLSAPGVSAALERVRAAVPDVRVDLHAGAALLRKLAGPGAQRFAGIVEAEGELWFRAIVARQEPGERIIVSVSCPVSPELLDGLASELGPIQLTRLVPVAGGQQAPLMLLINGRKFAPAGQIASRRRSLPAAANWLDMRINGNSILTAAVAAPKEEDAATIPVIASFSVRPSQLHHQLFTSLGGLGDTLVAILILVGIIFLLLEVAALATGIVLTRTITHAVADLYEATQHIRKGDFTHRVRLQRRDQLGVLGESFNAMASSIAELIEEQRQRQRLENELSIAREVQSQLFPQKLPALQGVQLAAICRAARVVSGDYYDFIPLGPTRLGLAVADISGKGISAALLMASLQAALRSQAVLDGRGGTAELVARVNQHLFHNTSDDRYATFFYAVYDTATRTLTYTNAGHLPPFYVVGSEVEKLDKGGTVVGLFDDCQYTQGAIRIAPGSLLIAFSDGLVEPENVYGEEFGTQRLMEEVLRHREASPQRLAESLLAATEQWAGTPEQADDMTVVVARLE